MKRSYTDITGQRFGKLTVIRRTDKIVGHSHLWECKCDCGNTTYVQYSALHAGGTKSCGCLQGLNFKRHGYTGKRVHNIWRGMLARCNNPNVRCYSRYGGRGITVCDEWQGENGFENFLEWAKNNGYSENLTLDRKDVNAGYSPQNCRWATTEEQANNTRRNRNITYNGKTQTLQQWVNEFDLNYGTTYSRIFIRGWEIGRAFNQVEKEE